MNEIYLFSDLEGKTVAELVAIANKVSLPQPRKGQKVTRIELARLIASHTSPRFEIGTAAGYRKDFEAILNGK